jgi:iron complex transport system ATP-binding protein
MKEEFVLSVRELVCSLGDRRVLDGVDLDVKAGEVVGILGANGAGKSTLLRCLGGLVPYTGQCTALGRDLARVGTRDRARMLALMHQRSDLAFPFPVKEVVAMGRFSHQRHLGGETAADRRAVAEALRATEIEELADRPVTALSGGERQRVFLAQALAQDTPLLCLDEPTSSLDLAHQEQIWGCVRTRAREGKAILAAVHDLRTAARTCDRLVLLAEGRALVSGTPDQVLNPEALSKAYGVKVTVYRNPVSGLLDYHFRHGERDTSRPHVHVIGGGGAAAELLRTLGQGGFRVTAGVLAPGDSDLLVAAAYGVPVITCLPFSPIGQAAFEDNAELARQADLTVVASLAIGAYNLANLEAAWEAQSLVLVEDSPPETRDFTGGPGLALYQKLRARARVVTGAEFAGWLYSWGSSRASGS